MGRCRSKLRWRDLSPVQEKTNPSRAGVPPSGPIPQPAAGDPRPAPTSLRPTAPWPLALIVVTDSGLAGGSAQAEHAALQALAAGAPAIQLRDKVRSTAELLPVARRLARACREHGALFFVNDRVDLALVAGAHGVHVGPEDLPVAAVRSMVPPDFLVGYSTDEPAVALQAREAGASYIGCGTLWTTTTKSDAGAAIGPDGLARVAKAVAPLPVVGIGGVRADRIEQLGGTGCAGVAVVGAVMGAHDPHTATRTLLKALETHL
ncbi:MAG: thiamine phosphate synthase [Gemmatimonadales bacterium]|nr:MAG: thiamine phosphate synthase [Gemmatimonadales bacterium]